MTADREAVNASVSFVWEASPTPNVLGGFGVGDASHNRFTAMSLELLRGPKFVSAQKNRPAWRTG